MNPPHEKKTIGILGGMGPEATAYMYSLIIKHTKVSKDQDHIRIFIDSNPKVPPRTEAIQGKGPSPVPLLIKGMDILKKAGADLAILPCVTAHYFMPEVLNQTGLPFISLLEESLHWAREKIPGLKTVGLIASTGTIVSRLFHETFNRVGIEVVSPVEPEQERVTEAIFSPQGIKTGYTSGRPKELIVDTARILIARGAEAVIAGCTEIPLVLSAEDISVPLIEPMVIVAQKSILEAGYEVR
jgi:aspartate racemase